MNSAHSVKTKQHYPEIDILRGFAIVSMMLIHGLYVGAFVKGEPFYGNVVVFLWSSATAGTFMVLSGLSLLIAAQRGKYGSLRVLLKRCLVFLTLGMCFTLATVLFDLGGKVYVGILHYMALSTFLGFYCIKWPKLLLFIVAVLAIVVGFYLLKIAFPTSFAALSWLYPVYMDTYYLDYFPLIPWFGFNLIGILLGKVFYSNRVARLPRPVSRWWLPLQFLGRHSLLVYFIHVPIIFLLLTLFRSIFS